MRRSFLLTISSLGLLICLIGSTGLFASLSDAARTGTNTVDSAALAVSADLQLASIAPPGENCETATYADNLLTGFFSVHDLLINQGYTVFFCIRNIGSRPVHLTAWAENVTDVDDACTGDEADYGDTTCGGGLAGELSGVLDVTFDQVDCKTGEALAGGSSKLDALEALPITLNDLGSNGAVCYPVRVVFLNESTSGTQQAQSDSVAWQFRFNAVAQP